MAGSISDLSNRFLKLRFRSGERADRKVKVLTLIRRLSYRTPIRHCWSHPRGLLPAVKKPTMNESVSALSTKWKVSVTSVQRDATHLAFLNVKIAGESTYNSNLQRYDRYVLHIFFTLLIPMPSPANILGISLWDKVVAIPSSRPYRQRPDMLESFCVRLVISRLASLLNTSLRCRSGRVAPVSACLYGVEL